MTKRTIERIVIALEPAAHNRAVIHTAVTLARQLGVVLEGVFVEDINLIHYASLPFARTLGHGAASRPLKPADMEQALRSQRQRLQRMLNEVAAQSRLEAVFTTLRGEVASALGGISGPQDLLILCRATRGTDRLGRTARQLLATVPASVLLLHPAQTLQRPVVVFFDGSEQGQRALGLAMVLAAEDERHLSVLYPATDADSLSQLRTLAENQLDQAELRARHYTLADNRPQAIISQFNTIAGRALVLGAHSPYLTPEAYELLSVGVDTPVLITR